MNREQTRQLATSRRIVEQSDRAAARGDLKYAESLLSKAITSSPDDSEIHWRLAKLLQQKNDRKGAIRECKKCISLLPNDLRSYREAAKLFYEEGDYIQAESYADYAFQIAPRDPAVLQLKARLARQRLDLDKAMEFYHLALGQYPEDLNTNYEMAELYVETKRPELAAPLLRERIASELLTKKQLAEINWKLGNVYADMKRWSDVELAYMESIKNSDDINSEKLIKLARVQMKIENNEKAKITLAETIRREPEHEVAKLMLSRLVNDPTQTADLPNIKPAALSRKIKQ